MERIVIVKLVILTAIWSLAAAAAEAEPTFESHLEGGFGTSVVRPLVSEGAFSAMASAGASVRLSRQLRVGLEITATAGGQVGMSIPEASSPRDRSLTTFLIGVEPISGQRGRGLFGFIGAGAGHMTLSEATGVFEPPFDRWLVPARSLTSFALGLAVGYRSGGPGPIGLQIGFRSHALVHGGRLPASAYALTLGLVY